LNFQIFLNSGRAFTTSPFDFLERNNLELDFSLPSFFTTAQDFLRTSIWGSDLGDPVRNAPSVNLDMDRSSEYLDEDESGYYDTNGLDYEIRRNS